MPKKQTAKPKQRTRVKDLPNGEKALSKEEQKKVKGGTVWTQKDTCNSTTTSFKPPETKTLV